MVDLNRIRRGVRRRAHEAVRPVTARIGSRFEPTFLVIGAQKAGTTALFAYLARHPEIAAPATKEVDFFGCPSRHARGTAFYHSHFPIRRGDDPRRTFEASPDYLATEGAAERIHGYRADMQLVVMLREPVERAFSAWQMYRQLHRRNPDWYRRWTRRCDATLPADTLVPRPPDYGHDFAADLRAELEVVGRGGRIEMPVVRHGHYHEQLATYLRWFPRSALHVERSDALRTDAIAALERAERFLGLSPHDWTGEPLRTEFEGGYHEAVPDDARRLLEEEYRGGADALRAVMGDDVSW